MMVSQRNDPQVFQLLFSMCFGILLEWPTMNLWKAVGTRPNWDIFASDYGYNSIQEFYDFYVNEIIHKEIVDKLRLEFPSTKIFTIPTGWATKNLAQMQLNETLLDEITLFGPKETSIFTDQKGHQGQIVIETGTLIWLSKIYNVSLQTNNYSTGFKTDLHYVAQEIIENHDSNY